MHNRHPWEIRYCPLTQEKYLCHNSTEDPPTVEIIGVASMGTSDWKRDEYGPLTIKGTLPKMKVMKVPGKEELTALLMRLRK